MKPQTLKLLRLLAACFIMVAIGEVALAQDNKDMAAAMKNSTPEQRAQMQTNLIKAKLKLDSAQATKVQAINLKYAKKMEPVLKGDGGRLAKFREAKSIAKDKDADLKKVLTDDQYKEYQAFEDEMKSKMKDRMSGASLSN